jgi:hypothetical protein
MVDKVTGEGFLIVLRFPLPILIPPTAPQSSLSSSGAGTIGYFVADVPRGLSLTPPQETKKKKKLHVINLEYVTVGTKSTVYPHRI